MKSLKTIYGLTLTSFIISNFFSKKTIITDSEFLYVVTYIGFPLLLIPFFSLTKAERFYRIAKKEGRTRKFNDKTDAPVEEEYKTDSMLYVIMLTLIIAFCTVYLWL